MSRIAKNSIKIPEGTSCIFDNNVLTVKGKNGETTIRVHDKFRNKGNGTKVMKYLIEKAKKLKIKRISIETGAGDFFIPARKLFKNCGFKTCKPFAHYKDDVNSIYLSKQINND